MRRQEAIANLVISFGPIASAAVFFPFVSQAILAPIEFGFFTLASYAVGLALFLLAKASLLRRGVLFSFGSGPMTPRYRLAYRTGYALMGLGLVATLTSLAVLDANVTP